MKRKANKAERFHMARVSRMGCIACELTGHYGTKSQVHHVRKTLGWGRDSHLDTIPLCPEHHTGKTGVHTLSREAVKKVYGKSEIEMLEIIKKRLGI